ncbi:uncharacterized protein LOC131801251 [Musca domestica]|uniref:Uncharacterized protein LOC131801251 n=1 Tax=Musca domestica TaxID=7370 RepID=A0ABM3UQ71_MUSDO|nr:uncharacterized protein LOC131801251 [Musca domestica]
MATLGTAELTSAVEKTTLQMAPEQGPDSKSHRGKTETSATEDESSQKYDKKLKPESLGWIYLLKKEQLIEQCQAAAIQTEGYTVEHLRRQLADFVRKKRLRSSTENLLRDLENELQAEEKTVVTQECLQIPERPPRRESCDSETMSMVQRWNLKFTGEGDLSEFLERLEELAECYRIPHDRLVSTLPCILEGNALKWYRVKKGDITTWKSFRIEAEKFFLSKRHLTQLEHSFYNRRQFNREKAKDFVLQMLTMAKQHPTLRQVDHLDRIYDGLRPEYRHYVRRSDFQTLDELMSLVDDFELLKKDEARVERPHTSHMVSQTSGGYNRSTHCWRCKKKGHIRYQCQEKGKLFCSHCGKEGILSRNCECRANPTIDTDHHGRYYIWIFLNGKGLWALVDTGASLTYIDSSVGKWLDTKRVKPITITRRVQLADQQMATCGRVYPVSIVFNDQATSIEATVLPTLAEPVVLGMDFLLKRGLDIVLDGKVVPKAAITDRSGLHYLHSISDWVLSPQKKNQLPENHVIPHRRAYENYNGFRTRVRRSFRVHTKLVTNTDFTKAKPLKVPVQSPTKTCKPPESRQRITAKTKSVSPPASLSKRQMAIEPATRDLLPKYQQGKTTKAAQPAAPAYYHITRPKQHDYLREASLSQAGGGCNMLISSRTFIRTNKRTYYTMRTTTAATASATLTAPTNHHHHAHTTRSYAVNKATTALANKRSIHWARGEQSSFRWCAAHSVRLKIRNDLELRFAVPQELRFAVPQELRFAVPQELRLAVPQELRFAVPQEFRLAVPQELRLAVPQEFRLAVPQELRLAVPQELRFAVPQELRLAVPQELRFAVPQEFRLAVPQELRLAVPQEFRLAVPQELRFAVPQELRFAVPQELRLAVPQEFRLAVPYYSQTLVVE